MTEMDYPQIFNDVFLEFLKSEKETKSWKKSKIKIRQMPYVSSLNALCFSFKIARIKKNGCIRMIGLLSESSIRYIYISKFGVGKFGVGKCEHSCLIECSAGSQNWIGISKEYYISGVYFGIKNPNTK